MLCGSCDLVQYNLVRNFEDKYSFTEIDLRYYLSLNIFSYKLNHWAGNIEDLNSQVCWHAQSCVCLFVCLDWLEGGTVVKTFYIYKTSNYESKLKYWLRMLTAG